jgi:hypothetical protein
VPTDPDGLQPLLALSPPDPDPVIAAVPCGPVVDTDAGRWGLATASFSADRTYRFRLSRVWDPAGPRLHFCMLNPSTADAFVLDPTVRRCVGFARAWGYGALEVTNVFALRSTDPSVLYGHHDPVGHGNDDAIRAAAAAAALTVAAWGVHATLADRNRAVLELLAATGATVVALRVTKDGHPGHPLYVPAAVTPLPWPPATR